MLQHRPSTLHQRPIHLLSDSIHLRNIRRRELLNDSSIAAATFTKRGRLYWSTGIAVKGFKQLSCAEW